jgi:hypothetical protein
LSACSALPLAGRGGEGGSSGRVDLYFFVGVGAVLASVGFLSCLLRRPRRSPRVEVSEPAAAVSPGAPLQ